MGRRVQWFFLSPYPMFIAQAMLHLKWVIIYVVGNLIITMFNGGPIQYRNKNRLQFWCFLSRLGMFWFLFIIENILVDNVEILVCDNSMYIVMTNTHIHTHNSIQSLLLHYANCCYNFLLLANVFAGRLCVKYPCHMIHFLQSWLFLIYYNLIKYMLMHNS